MAKLSEMVRQMQGFLELHGDRNVVSISSGFYTGSVIQYVLNMHKIGAGPVEKNPYAGQADHIYIPREAEEWTAAAKEGICQMIDGICMELANAGGKDAAKLKKQMDTLQAGLHVMEQNEKGDGDG